MMRAEAILELQQEWGHDSASYASGPYFRIAPLAGRRRTRSVFAFPKLSQTLLPAKPPGIQSTVSAGREATPSAIVQGQLVRRKKGQSQSRPARQGPTGKYCVQGVPETSQVHRGESAQPRHG